MTKKIAIGSSDGKVVNAHFGRTPQFLIVEISETGHRLLEVRENQPGCSNLNEPKGTMEETLELVGDCDYIIVSRIGKPMIERLAQRGITALAIADMVEDSIERVRDLAFN